MLCEHLQPLEQQVTAQGLKENYRGQAWSDNCREWVYYECWLDLAALRSRMAVADCVKDHENTDPHSGTERGFVCEKCKDGLMGRLEKKPELPVIA